MEGSSQAKEHSVQELGKEMDSPILPAERDAALPKPWV